MWPDRRLSANFWLHEFWCKGAGKEGHTPHAVTVVPELVAVVQGIRDEVGKPIQIISGHRCPWWNRRVGGARRSQHLLGRAADLRPGLVTVDMARRHGARGIGIAADGSVVHVDVRTGRRATWRYS